MTEPEKQNLDADLTAILEATQEGQGWLDKGVDDLAFDSFITIGEAAKRVVNRLKLEGIIDADS